MYGSMAGEYSKIVGSLEVCFSTCATYSTISLSSTYSMVSCSMIKKPWCFSVEMVISWKDVSIMGSCWKMEKALDEVAFVFKHAK